MFLCDHILYIVIYLHINIPGLPASTKGIYFQPASFSASSYGGTQPTTPDRYGCTSLVVGFDILIFLDHLGHIDLVQSPPGHQQHFVGGAGERKKKESQILVWDHLGCTFGTFATATSLALPPPSFKFLITFPFPFALSSKAWADCILAAFTLASCFPYTSAISSLSPPSTSPRRFTSFSVSSGGTASKGVWSLRADVVCEIDQEIIVDLTV